MSESLQRLVIFYSWPNCKVWYNNLGLPGDLPGARPRFLVDDILRERFCLGFYSDNFIIGLTDVNPGLAAPTPWNYDVCGQYPGVVCDGATVSLECTRCMTPHRYLIVQIDAPVAQYLNFCELEVYVGSKYNT